MYRIHRELKLNLRIKPRNRFVRAAPQPLIVSLAMNAVWSMDVMYDQLKKRHRIRLLNVIDDLDREALSIEIDLSLPLVRVIRVLLHITERRGRSLAICCDSRPEYPSEDRVSQTRDRQADRYLGEDVAEQLEYVPATSG